MNAVAADPVTSPSWPSPCSPSRSPPAAGMTTPRTAWTRTTRSSRTSTATTRRRTGGGGFFWLYGGSLVSGNRYATGTRLKGGEKVAASNVAENARRGGFGSSSGSKTSASGVGRAAASHSGGG